MLLSVASQWKVVLGSSMILFVVLMFFLSYIANKRIENVDDYVVAGRRLPLFLSSATLLATWFGAGTLLTATDEIRNRGVTGATLDPIGAGICLLLVGFLFAAPLWSMKLRTLPDLFRLRFNKHAEIGSSLLMIPPYLGWIAAQFMALAGLLKLFFGIPVVVGLSLVALVGIGYTIVGGMWAVALTDAVQMALVIVGLIVMAVSVLWTLGSGDMAAGWARLLKESTPQRLQLIPAGSAAAFTGWLGVLFAGSLGNVPSQDVMQRVFSAQSAKVARRACLIAGTLYLLLGLIPVLLGLAAPILLPNSAKTGTLALLAKVFLHPAMSLVMVLTIMSAVLSTIDSAILAPATVLAQNLLKRTSALREADELKLNRVAVLVIGLTSLAVAYAGESAYGLLESGYELGMVSLMAPLALGLWLKKRSNVGILASMVFGTSVWLVHQIAGWKAFLGMKGFPLPVGILSMLFSFGIYFVLAPFFPQPSETVTDTDVPSAEQA